MKKLVVLLIAAGGLLSGCLAYAPPDQGVYTQDRYRDGTYRRDSDRDGVPNRADRDRDGDGVPNRQDRRPDDPRRY